MQVPSTPCRFVANPAMFSMESFVRVPMYSSLGSHRIVAGTRISSTKSSLIATICSESLQSTKASSAKSYRFFASMPLSIVRSYSTCSEDTRKWAEKESLGTYLQSRVSTLEKYFQTVQRSPEEDRLAERIMARYLNKEAYRYEESLPYRLKLQVSNKTAENAGPNFFSERELAFYLENGFVGPRKISSISTGILKKMHERFSGMLKGSTPDQNRSKVLRQEWRDVDVFDLVTNKEIVSRISSILGDNIKMRYTSMHEVPPGEGSFSEMTKGHIADFYAHSDMNLGTAVIPKEDTVPPFCDVDAVSAWVSISGTNAHNAPLFFFPKTHQWDITTPLTFLENTKNDKKALALTCKLLSTRSWANQLNAQHYLFYNYLLNSHYQQMLETTRKTEMYMERGECVFFTTHLLHGSGVNYQPLSRLGISIRYSRATNPENEENLSVVKGLFSESERVQLGLKKDEDRIPIFQVLGTKHHEKSVPVDLVELRKILVKKSLPGGV